MRRLLVKVAVVGLLMAATGVAVWMHGRHGGSPGIWEPQVSDKETLSVLKSEAMAFLVTRRTTTQLVIEHSESGLLGEWDGVYWVTVRWLWGVDMSKLSEKDLRREGNKIICRLPDPELLEFAPKLETEKFYSKSTFIPKIREIFTGGQLQVLRDRLEQEAGRFAREQNLCPTRAEIAAQLNASGSVIRKMTGNEVVFE